VTLLFIKTRHIAVHNGRIGDTMGAITVCCNATPLSAALVCRGIGYWPVLIWTARHEQPFVVFLPREMAMLGKIVMTLLAFSSAALAQQQQCQLECTLLNKVGKLKSQKAATIWMLSNALW
jgi:hypothetical protein